MVVKHGLLGRLAEIRFADGSSTTPIALLTAQGALALTGTPGADLMQGTAGNDMLDGGAGSDTLVGGEGNDTLTGGQDAAPDTLDGGAGDDTLIASPGGATMSGGAGADAYVLGAGGASTITDDGGRIRMTDPFVYSVLRATLAGNNLTLSAPGFQAVVNDYAANAANWTLEDPEGTVMSMVDFLALSAQRPHGQSVQAVIADYQAQVHGGYVQKLLAQGYGAPDVNGTMKLSTSLMSEGSLAGNTSISYESSNSTRHYADVVRQSDSASIARGTGDIVGTSTTSTTQSTVATTTTKPGRVAVNHANLVWVPEPVPSASNPSVLMVEYTDPKTGQKQLLGHWERRDGHTVYENVDISTTVTKTTINQHTEIESTLSLEEIRAGASDNVISTYGYSVVDAGDGDDKVSVNYRRGSSDFPITDTSGSPLGALLYGNAGDDTLNGGEGADWLIGGQGSDTLDGRAGGDRYVAYDEDSVDSITDTGDDLYSYKDWYYKSIGITDWETYDGHAGEYYAYASDFADAKGYYASFQALVQALMDRGWDVA